MTNPKSPYPGRQIFVGTTVLGDPCFIYLVTGRNKDSRERKAKKIGNIVRIMPSKEGAPFDPLRHYIAVKYDDGIKLAVITNGIQTEAIFEAYRLWINLDRPDIINAPKMFHYILEHAGPEPDSYGTPRIAAVIFTPENGTTQMIIGINGEIYTQVREFVTVPGHNGRLSFVSTYTGNLDNPKPNTHSPISFTYECLAKTSLKLAKHIYGISAATYKGEDIRVCSVAGIFINGKWKISITNTL